MLERWTDSNERPLPREWLPDDTPPERGPEWEAALQSIVAAAEPALRELENRVPTIEALASWWKPAAALAAAAASLLLLQTDRTTGSAQDRVSLSVLAAQGEPIALWEGVGIEADPVLALLALEQPSR